MKTKSMMKRKSQAKRSFEKGFNMRVPKDVKPSRMMWLAIPAATAMLLAVQAGYGAMFVALLKIRRSPAAFSVAQ